ncbi:MFS transporter [Paractinoplanes durhamensis]|uniref:MFS transporter n=1 Tax=Paractinoplanes durhamensis TaxID=113563 RepID=A0ABQ3YWI7_9ACTN|nr:MFS transporter [Actinoplanes durhamensis]
MAATAVFFVNGLTMSTYIVRAPSIKAAYHLSDGQFGSAGLLFALAALACMQAVGPLAARVGVRRVLCVTLTVMPLLLAGLAVAGDPRWFVACTTMLGAVHGTTDAAMNSLAVAVERRAGRPVLNGCHAAWSISTVVAASSTAALARVGVGLGVHLVASGALLLVAGVVVGRCMPHVEDANVRGTSADRVGVRHGWSRALLTLGLTATAVMICEGGVLGWGGIFLHDHRHATLTVAAIAITAYTGGQTLGRLGGDAIADRTGGRALFRLGAAVATGGLAIALLVPDPITAVAGFAVAGIGSSVLIPLTFSAVGRRPGIPTATLVARMTTFTYTGILLAPALIGWTAERIGLGLTMTALLPLMALVAVIPRPSTDDPAERPQ